MRWECDPGHLIINLWIHRWMDGWIHGWILPTNDLKKHERDEGFQNWILKLHLGIGVLYMHTYPKGIYDLICHGCRAWVVGATLSSSIKCSVVSYLS